MTELVTQLFLGIAAQNMLSYLLKIYQIEVMGVVRMDIKFCNDNRIKNDVLMPLCMFFPVLLVTGLVADTFLDLLQMLCYCIVTIQIYLFLCNVDTINETVE